MQRCGPGGARRGEALLSDRNSQSGFVFMFLFGFALMGETWGGIAYKRKRACVTQRLLKPHPCVVTSGVYLNIGSQLVRLPWEVVEFLGQGV